MATKQLNERVAVLETTIKHLTAKLDAILEGVEEVTKNQATQQKLIDRLNSRWGFAMLVVSSTGAVILACKDWILFKLGLVHG